MMMVKRLEFIYDRLINVHGENKNYDYMKVFKKTIKQCSKLLEENRRLKERITELEWKTDTSTWGGIT